MLFLGEDKSKKSKSVTEVEKADDYKAHYLGKHPYLQDFQLSPSSALIRMEVRSYILAGRFHNVMDIDMA